MANSRANEIDGHMNGIAEEYDYIICGGGTSGCVVAGRLAEDLNVKVLVIEAGPDNANLENVHMPAGWNQNFEKETDWNIVGTPQASLDGRQVKQSRGRFLGGSSGVNGCLCLRGSKQDYDDWGLEGWSGDEMHKYMAKAETLHTEPWFKPAPGEHGTTGPLQLGPHKNAPISDLFMESYKSMGLPYYDDMFTVGAPPNGCGHVLRTIHNGIRSTAADFITVGHRRDNITILVDTSVDKVLIEDADGGLKATGVAIVTKSGEKKTLRARKEVIVSGGAYCSPAILMRSGVGAKEEVEALGIQCKVDLPGVGKNLMDHPLLFFFYETDNPDVSYDHLLYHGNSLASTYELYKTTKTGPLSVFPFGSFAYARIDDRLSQYPEWRNAPCKPGRDAMGQTPNQPNVEFWNTEAYGGPLQYTNFPIDNKHTFGLVCILMNAKSRGTVTINSTDVNEIPTVDHNYLSDPLDMLVLSEGCHMGNEIVTKGKGTKDLVTGSWPRSESHHSYKTREEWVPFVKRFATTCYHAAGTCKMGKADDPMAVLDEKLRVKGVQGLRVIDVSVMPNLNNGHTQMPAYGIGEKGADLIKEAALSAKA
ncbi:putative GMC oxidoreductase [Rhizodiscina lignyota]|uniref:GMC oxidoreductase n=1 Tax=Rhizodiscina lignyota TaxID=1504668 RepID=A0A9P4M5V4_9PEZI|nr:putative GMC oxidoreductase [Rhizodiscina lignyota]